MLWQIDGMGKIIYFVSDWGDDALVFKTLHCVLRPELSKVFFLEQLSDSLSDQVN
jgi:hypothetical protein